MRRLGASKLSVAFPWQIIGNQNFPNVELIRVKFYDCQELSWHLEPVQGYNVSLHQILRKSICKGRAVDLLI